MLGISIAYDVSELDTAIRIIYCIQDYIHYIKVLCLVVNTLKFLVCILIHF